MSVTSRSLSGYWNGSSNHTSMTSGPDPTFAATAAFGRMSSQLSLSMRTSTPVASVNFLVLAIHWSSSPFTKGDQRRSRKEAPGSGLKIGAAACARAGPLRRPGAKLPAARPAPPSRMSRLERVMRFLRCSCLAARRNSVQASACLGVEQVRRSWVGRDTDGLTGLRQDAVAEHADHLLTAAPHHDLRLRAHRLDHHDLDRHASAV